MKAIIRIETRGYAQMREVWASLETMVERNAIDGFFTLTLDGEPCAQEHGRDDLLKLAASIAASEGITP
jgi:hypothetical protein